jgi:serine/threonine protein kinase
LFVKTLGWYETERSVFIVMEHMKYGSLASHLHRPLPEEEVKHITFQVLEGLASLHESGFVHRDLKPDVSEALPL